MFHTDINNSQCSTNIYVTNHTKIKWGSGSRGLGTKITSWLIDFQTVDVHKVRREAQRH